MLTTYTETRSLLNLTRQQKIDRFNKMYDRVEKQIMKEKIDKLFDFIDKEPHPVNGVNAAEKGRMGIFIAMDLITKLTDAEKKLFSKRKDLYNEAERQATERFPDDKRMIKKVTLNMYGLKIYTEFLAYYWDHKDVKSRVKN